MSDGIQVICLENMLTVYFEGSLCPKGLRYIESEHFIRTT